MPPGAKKTIMQPIDRPIARAYLRQFTGWSTSYPPGMSDSTSLRTMHNCNIDPDGALRIRPGLRRAFKTPAGGDIVGSFEHFYTNESPARKAILFAIRDPAQANKVVFRTAVYNTTTNVFDIDPSISTRFGAGATDALLGFAADTTYVKYLQIDNKILALSDNAQSFRLFFVGSNPRAKVPAQITRPIYSNLDRPPVFAPTATWVNGPQDVPPSSSIYTDTTLISSDETKNTYNFGYYYSFNNDIGESLTSPVGYVQAQRRWSAWQANSTDPAKSLDQMVIRIPQAVWDAAVVKDANLRCTEAGAISWNLYWVTWSNQDNVPPEGQLLRTVPIVGKTYNEGSWAAHTPFLQGLDISKTLPSPAPQDNFSIPSTAGTGIVAGDRLVLVLDRNNAARIQWTSNLQGDYLNFSSSKGGGFKTLTSGNLFIPANVKLWQNPQSVDTLTVMCMGIDGYGTSYYMNPNTSITTQSQSTSIMGFEETTATPGTVAPYGCEVLNNALYHPLDNNLMKSSASNYNINHKTTADAIQNIWHQVSAASKRKMVSSQMDNSLYFLVQSPVGWLSSPASNGNQVWTCATGDSDIWSAWDVIGTSLRKLEIKGLLYMGITSGPSIFVFDPEQDHDDVWDGTQWIEQGIPWEAVTNTQGANKAHDAWSWLQQVNVTFGNFTGECDYGIRGKDANGQWIEVSKHYVAPQKGHDPLDRYDQEDYLQIRKVMKEWEFFWKSNDKPKNRSYGSVCFVQYRYAPISVNVGYEYGSVETFEYGSRTAQYVNGTPLPNADIQKP